MPAPAPQPLSILRSRLRPVLAGAALLLPAAAAAALLAPAVAAADTPVSLTGNLLVLTAASSGHAPLARTAAVARAVTASGAQVERAVPQIGLLAVKPAAGLTLGGLSARLRRLPGVASVEAERSYVPRLVPNDPALSTPDAASGVLEWALGRENFPVAWGITQGVGALVGVIDSGIDATHPDLSGKIAAAVDQEDGGGTATTDGVGHGTHVSSLACAATGNGFGMAGAGYDCKLVVEKTDFTDGSIAASLVDAADRHVQAINMSFGPSEPSDAPAPASEVRALQYAAAQGVVLVAAAADDPVTTQGDPANVLQPPGTGPNLTQGLGLDVTAAQYSGQRASFAGYGSEISMAAYGDYGTTGAGLFGLGGQDLGIFGAFPSNNTQIERSGGLSGCHCRTAFDGGRSWAYLSGTSMAAPQVAATAAMMRTLNPYATVAEVIRTLKATASRPAGTGFSNDLGWGVLNAGAAVDAIRRIDHLPPLAVVGAPKISRRRTFVVHWAGHDQRPPGLVASGIVRYQVYVQQGSRRRLLTTTTRHSLRFRGRRGQRYTFLVFAIDRAGNRSRSAARTQTRVGPKAT